MSPVISHVRQFLAKEHAATVAEYGLILALLSVIAIVAIIAIGRYVNGAFTGVADELEAVNAPKVP